MKGFLIGCGSLIALGLVLVVAGVIWYFSVQNREVGLRNQAKAQQKSNELVFDNMWKTIAQVTEVADDYSKEDFRAGWKEILSAGDDHSKAGGTINIAVNRINPKLDSSLRKRIQTVIEGGRKEFLNNQRALVAIKKEHDDLRMKAPSSWIVGGAAELEITVVTSTRTDGVFRDGKDDEISIRPKKQEPAKAK